MKPGAKFCGGCGNKVEQKTAPSATCSSCGRELKPGAKFCGGCGNKVEQAAAKESPVVSVVTETGTETVTAPAEVNSSNGILSWNIQPGQIAVKIDEQEIAAYEKGATGVNIQEGVKALVFLQGKIIAELESGRYLFKDAAVAGSSADNNSCGFLKGICKFFSSAVQTLLHKQTTPAISFVLVRAREFPLCFVFNDVMTKGVSADIGLHVLCQISNINAFYADMMLDRKFVCYEAVAAKIKPVFTPYLTQALSDITPDAISNDVPLAQRLLGVLQSAAQNVYPFINVTNIISLTASNEDLDNIRKMSEELYVSEQELTQLNQRNEFLNRLTAAQHEQELAVLTQHGSHEISISELEARQMVLKNKVFQDMALAKDQQEKFDLMLEAQKKIRNAQSEEDIAQAMHEFQKSGMFREQELENLQSEFKHNAELRELSNVQAIAMATLQNQKALDQAQLDWEMQIGNKRLQNQIDRQRMQDDYSDERRMKDAAFADSRRQANFAFEQQEQQSQLDMLRQAQAIRMERENEEHRRRMEAENAAREHDLAKDKLKFDAENDNTRIYAGMSAEQILAMKNPDAAAAFARKFEAEAAAAQSDKTAQMAIDAKNEMKEFMQQQMAMMQQMTMQQMNNNAAIQQTMAQNNNYFQQQQLAAKEAEMMRVYQDSQRHNSDVLSAMSTTVRAVSDMNRPMPPPQQRKDMAPQSEAKQGPVATFCPECGKPVNGMFCEECGYKF